MLKTKRKIKLNELVDAEAEFVSIVGRGANNIPFREIKQENGEMDLSKLFKKDDIEPYVASIVVSKSADIEEAKKKIEKAGFSTDKMEEQEDIYLFIQKEVPEVEKANQSVLKYNDSIAAVVVTKYFETWDFETTSFNELFSKTGALPTMRAAHEALWEVMLNIMFNADTNTPEDCASKVSTAIKEYRTFMTDMVKNLPSSAFKMEDPSLAGELETTKKEETVMTDEVEKKEVETPEQAETEEAATEEVAEGGSEEAAVAEEKEEADKAETEESVAEEPVAEKKEDGALAEIMKTLKGLSDDMKELRDTVEKSNKESEALKTRVEEVAEIAKSADTALNGTVNADAQGDRATEKKTAEVKKSGLTSSAYRRGNF